MSLNPAPHYALGVRRLVTLSLFALLALPAAAADARIIKVLPHHLDQQGRHATAPSLFERDAYQARLRAHPEERSAIRFDIQWKAHLKPRTGLALVLESRGTRGSGPLVLEANVKPRRWFSSWTSITITREMLELFGEPAAWRVSLWDGETFVAEQKSFLW